MFEVAPLWPPPAAGLAVVVLNVARDAAEEPLFRRLWAAAELRVCADGGANRLFALPGAAELAAPDAIVGDLDSLRDDVAAHYRGRGAAVVPAPDQDTHDFDKALAYVHALPGAGARRVVAVGAFGGRLDQEMANLNMLLKWQGAFGSLALLSAQSLAVGLPAGLSVVRPSAPGLLETGVCGLLPLAGPAVVTTAGLQWNLDRGELRFGGLVSSSNCVTGEVVAVRSSAPLIWTATVSVCSPPKIEPRALRLALPWLAPADAAALRVAASALRSAGS